MKFHFLCFFLCRIIGHGAFGEVFEGWLCLNNNTGGDAQTITTTTTTGGDGDENQCIAGGGGGGGQQEVKVAVKSLPIESANDFGDDFEMEARLLRLAGGVNCAENAEFAENFRFDIKLTIFTQQRHFAANSSTRTL